MNNQNSLNNKMYKLLVLISIFLFKKIFNKILMSNKIISVTIKNILIDNNKFIIVTNDANYSTTITKGSIDCDIESSEKKILPLSYLEIGDLIKIKLKDNIINKIYVKPKYIILSESSEDYIS